MCIRLRVHVCALVIVRVERLQEEPSWGQNATAIITAPIQQLFSMVQHARPSPADFHYFSYFTSRCLALTRPNYGLVERSSVMKNGSLVDREMPSWLVREREFCIDLRASKPPVAERCNVVNISLLSSRSAFSLSNISVLRIFSSALKRLR